MGIEQLDVKTTFLHGELDETIDMHQLDGSIRPADERNICLLKKSLYGLKHDSRQWHTDEHMLNKGFSRS